MARTEPARGMRDFLPEDVRRRAHVIGVIARVYERYGFEPLETPAVENLETLLGKYGDEGNQLIFKILKRGEHEASGQADLALRYDLTVPLARVIAHHHAKLPRLFKRYQIQPVWRADRPARGRFREFYQCDVDALGSTSPAIEAELCAAVAEALLELGFADFVIRLESPPAADVDPDACGGSGGAARRPPSWRSTSWTRSAPTACWPELAERGVAARRRGRRALARSDPPATRRRASSQRLGALVAGDAAGDGRGREPAADRGARRPAPKPTAACASTRRWRAGSPITPAPSWRLRCPTWPAAWGAAAATTTWSACSSGQEVPACGFSLGLERILVVMGEREHVSAGPGARGGRRDGGGVRRRGPGRTPSALAGRLRSEGLRVLVYPDADKIGKQIKYADSRGVPFVALLGSNEIAAGTVTVKDLKAQTQQTYDQTAAGAQIRQALEALKDRG